MTPPVPPMDGLTRRRIPRVKRPSLCARHNANFEIFRSISTKIPTYGFYAESSEHFDHLGSGRRCFAWEDFGFSIDFSFFRPRKAPTTKTKTTKIFRG